MTNKEIAQALRDVAASYTIKDEKKFLFQILAYKKAADSIENLSTQLSDLYKENQLENIPGIGTTLRSRIEELFKTGKVSHWESAMKDIPKPVFALMRIPSFGPKKAFRISQEFGLSDPETAADDVLKLASEGKIAGLEGFGEKSQNDIIRAVEEYKKGFGKTTRMVLPYAYEIGEKVLEYLRDLPSVKKAEMLGSLRRMSPTVGDVDIAVASDNPGEVIKHFVKYPHKERVIEEGPSTSSMLVSGGHQVDLMVQPVDRFGSLLQHFTGSKNHNVALREFALKKGLSLSERGIKKGDKSGELVQTFDTEEKFYQAIGLDWIPPELREDTGEIELASIHNLPKIININDIKGDFHLHSSFPIEPSHDLGLNSISEMVQKALNLEYKYMSFSEHNPSISKHSKSQIIDLIKRRNDEIDNVQDKNKDIKIFKSMETDILPDGSLALSDEALDLLDFSIVSIHSVFSMEKDKMTERILKGLSHPKAKILAHPTGRLLNQRPSYELNFEKIFEFVKRNKKILEINAYPDRLDLTDSLIREAVKKEVNMIIDTDSHRASQMDLLMYGVAMSRRGWATKKDIINTWDLSDVLDCLIR